VVKRLDGRWDAEIKMDDGETYHIGKRFAKQRRRRLLKTYTYHRNV